ncbi:MAG: immunoglobulin-like domain-containing protein [Bacteroides sp.]
MYYTNSRWKKFKNGMQHSNFKLYLVILLILAVIIAFTFANSELISNMISSDKQEQNGEEGSIVPTQSATESTTFISQNYSYFISINKAENFITVYKTKANGEREGAFKTFRCSVNPSVSTGTYKTYEKNIWRALSTGGYGQYSTRISSDCYIHSVPYYSQNSNALNMNAYNNLGNPAKVGSIYLASADAQWIFENCALDTGVEVYEKSGETPEIALAEHATLSKNNGYDPTDTSLNITPVPTQINYMTGVNDHSIPLGSVYNMWDGVYAVDKNGNDITSYITVTGSVNTNVAGTYTLIYHLKDNFGTDLAYYSYVTVY